MFNKKSFVVKGLVLAVVAVFFFAGIMISCGGDDDGGTPLYLPAAFQNTNWLNDATSKSALFFTSDSVSAEGNIYKLQAIVDIDSKTQLQFSTSRAFLCNYIYYR